MQEMGDALIQNHLREVQREVPGTAQAWPVGTGRGRGRGGGARTTSVQGPQAAGCLGTGKPDPSLSAVSLLLPLLAKSGIVPAGRGKAFQGPRAAIAEQAKRMLLEVQDDKPKTGAASNLNLPQFAHLSNGDNVNFSFLRLLWEWNK